MRARTDTQQTVQERVARAVEAQRQIQAAQARDIEEMRRLIASGRLARVVNLGP